MNAVTPVTHPSRVVSRTEKPKELMISEYWFVRPLAISWDQAWRKNIHVLGSLMASMNLELISGRRSKGGRRLTGIS